MPEPLLSPGWRPFAILPSGIAEGEPRLAELANYDESRIGAVPLIRESWPARVVAINLAWNAVYWGNTKPKTRRRTIGDDMRRWIAQTRGLADRLPYGGSLAQEMRSVAERLQRHLDWRTEHFQHPPREIGTKRDSEHRCSLNLWALDRFVRALAKADPALNLRVTTIWRDLLPDEPKKLRTPIPASWRNYEQAQRRVKRIEADLKPGAANALMADILRQTLANAHFGPDGKPRRAVRPH